MAKQVGTGTGEQVIYATKHSAIRVFFWPTVISAVSFIGMFRNVNWIIGLTIGLVLLAVAGLRYWLTDVQVTSRRVLRKHGIFRSTEEIRLSKVESAEVKRGLIDWITASGTVVVRGSGGSPLFLKAIHAPGQLRQQISECAEMNSGQ